MAKRLFYFIIILAILGIYCLAFKIDWIAWIVIPVLIAALLYICWYLAKLLADRDNDT